jgi:hypothetical protein
MRPNSVCSKEENLHKILGECSKNGDNDFQKSGHPNSTKDPGDNFSQLRTKGMLMTHELFGININSSKK